jgi:hypothetical protein
MVKRYEIIGLYLTFPIEKLLYIFTSKIGIKRFLKYGKNGGNTLVDKLYNTKEWVYSNLYTFRVILNNFENIIKDYTDIQSSVLNNEIFYGIVNFIDHDNQRKCVKCNILKINSDFSMEKGKYRGSCRACRTSARHTRETDTKSNNDNFTCTSCEMVYMIEDKAKSVNKCLPCYNNRKIESAQIGACIKKYKDMKINTKFYLNNIEVTIKEYYTDFVKKFSLEKCFYCGKQGLETSKIGIDRICSNKEYTLENCVPCCKICNIMKNTLDIASFLRKVREIALFNQEILNLDKQYQNELQYHPEYALIGNSADFAGYKHGAKERNLDFIISRELFNKLKYGICYLCGKSDIKGLGIDRKNSSLGYTVENSFSCCSYCNFLKGDILFGEFLNHIKGITIYSTTEKHYELSDSAIISRAVNFKVEDKIVL